MLKLCCFLFLFSSCLSPLEGAPPREGYLFSHRDDLPRSRRRRAADVARQLLRQKDGSLLCNVRLYDYAMYLAFSSDFFPSELFVGHACAGHLSNT